MEEDDDDDDDDDVAIQNEYIFFVLSHSEREFEKTFPPFLSPCSNF